jgi:hypothetical protein
MRWSPTYAVIAPSSLGAQVAHFAGGVRTLQGGQVERRDRQADALSLGGALDQARAELRRSLLDPDPIDMCQLSAHCRPTLVLGAAGRQPRSY